MTNGVVYDSHVLMRARAKILDIRGRAEPGKKSPTSLRRRAPTDFMVSVTGSTGGAFTLDNLSPWRQLREHHRSGPLNGIAGAKESTSDTNGNVHMAGLIVNYGGLPTGGGIAVIRATFSKTGGTTSIAAQNLMTAAPAGILQSRCLFASDHRIDRRVYCDYDDWMDLQLANHVGERHQRLLAGHHNTESDGTAGWPWMPSSNIHAENTVAGAACTSRVWDLYVVLERLTMLFDPTQTENISAGHERSASSQVPFLSEEIGLGRSSSV